MINTAEVNCCGVCAGAFPQTRLLLTLVDSTGSLQGCSRRTSRAGDGLLQGERNFSGDSKALSEASRA